MKGSGTALGGLLGGLVGGPVGAGVGAAVGHYLGDARRPPRALELVQLRWAHHAFGPSGPGVVLTPVWRARGLVDADVTVRVDAGTLCQTAVVAPEHPVEEVAAPEWLVPYACFAAGEDAEVTVTLRAAPAGREAVDRDTFVVPMPRAARRLGNSGPGRVVMAMVACGRAGGRALTADDLDYLRLRVGHGHPLDADGARWLDAWLQELLAAEGARLAADRVAERLATHVDAEAAARVLLWLMHATRACGWGDAAERYVAALAGGLGVDGRLAALWRQVASERDPVARVRAARVLGVQPGTPLEDARRAYRALVQQWHPDRAPSPEAVAVHTARTAAITAAWRIYAASPEG